MIHNWSNLGVCLLKMACDASKIPKNTGVKQWDQSNKQVVPFYKYKITGKTAGSFHKITWKMNKEIKSVPAMISSLTTGNLESFLD